MINTSQNIGQYRKHLNQIETNLNVAEENINNIDNDLANMTTSFIHIRNNRVIICRDFFSAETAGSSLWTAFRLYRKIPQIITI